MNIIVLTPHAAGTGVAGFTADRRAAACMLRTRHAAERGAVADALTEAANVLRSAGPDTEPAVAIYIPFGGAAFAKPTVLDDNALSALRALAGDAPIHAPAAAALAETTRDTLPAVPEVILVSGSGFFAALPEREASYGLDPGLAGGPRRTGFHGLFHEAGFAEAQHRLRAARHDAPAHVISLCLEPRPEVAGIIGGRPVMVTGGVTPLEGLPGHTTCGEVDPSVVLKLYRDLTWGPERINRTLNLESGLTGLADRPITLRHAFRPAAPEHALAGDVLRYRLLQAFGAAMAAMGRVDGVVVSGRFASAGMPCAEELARRLRGLGSAGPSTVPTCLLNERLERLVADSVMCELVTP